MTALLRPGNGSLFDDGARLRGEWTSTRAVLETAAACLLSTVLTMALAYWAGENPFSAGAYVRWDSKLYFDIAKAGSKFFSCAELPGYNPADWCGNAGWMPAYPMLLRLFMGANVDIARAAFFVSHLFLFCALFVLRGIVVETRPGKERIALMCAAIFPGAIYLHAAFPISAFALYVLLCILSLSRGQFLAGSLLAACAAAVYSSGVMLSALVGASVLLLGRDPPGLRLAKAVGFGSIAFSGFCSVLIYHHISTGHWDAFFLIQAKYGHNLTSPFKRIVYEVQQLSSGNPGRMAIAVQTLSVGVVCIAAIGHRIWLRNVKPTEAVAGLYVLLFWLFPLSLGGDMTLTRAEANLLPLVILLVALPRAAISAVVALFAVLYVFIAPLFFKSILV